SVVTSAGELQGVGAVSHVLFGKAPHGLSTPESLVLAALLRAPNATSAKVVERAEKLGAVDHAELVLAAARLASSSTPQGAPVALAPHAAARILKGRDASGRAVRVASTLDGRLQRVVIDTLTRQLLAVRDQRVQDGAVLVVDNATPHLLAYVPSTPDLSTPPPAHPV